MVELIPPNYYVFKEEDFVQSTKYFHHKKSNAGKLTTTTSNKKDSVIQAKKARLDPNNFKTVHQLKQEIEEVYEKEEQEENDAETNISRLPKVNLSEIESIPLFELRERLKNKIMECRLKRKAPSTENEKDTRKPPKRKKDKQSATKTHLSKKSVAKENSYKKIDEGTESNIVFNKFDFSVGIVGVKNSQVKKKKNLQKLLVKAEANQKKLEEMNKADSSKAQELAEKIKWQNVLDKAQGKQKKDNPSLLKKTIKKREKQKKASSKKWKERTAVQQQLKEKKQEKRQSHIQERIDTKKAKLSGKKRKSKVTKKVIIRS